MNIHRPSVAKILFFCSLISLFGSINAQTVSDQEGIFALFETNKGSFTVKLEYLQTPIAVSNFIQLVTDNYYDKYKISYQIQNFIIPIGPSLDTQPMGLGYQFPIEVSSQRYFDNPYVLFVERLGDNSSSSNLLLSKLRDTKLNGKYSVLGLVVKGFKTVDKLHKNDTIKNITIVREGTAATNFSVDIAQAKEAYFKKTYPEVFAFLSQWGNYTTKDGIYIKKLTEAPADASSLSKNDRISVHYIGKLLNGNEFDNSYLRGKPLSLRLGVDDNTLIPGFRNVLKDMKFGDQWEVLIPPNLAYGSNQVGDIVPNSWLVFEISMLKP